uniref:Formamidopyrimidine-DNA glycosylase H2TH DNA-binding domain-containing protein n=1 Tax=Calidris pygmaea TaxID=425635 RepID=A0A8C3JY09_9CHAR
MVEGPGCTLCGERLRARVRRGQAVRRARGSAESERKVRMMESLDVCSPKFSFSRAEGEIKQQQSRMLCDVLLDQAVLPGVGNIIKNEALFDSGLHPAVKVGEKFRDCF